MNRKSLAGALALMAVLAMGARADDTPPATENTAADAAAPSKDKFVADLASRYNVPESDIVALRQKGMGWGEIGHALAI